MIQRSLHFSSKIRQKVGMSKAHDFTIKFNPALKLSSDRHIRWLLTENENSH